MNSKSQETPRTIFSITFSFFAMGYLSLILYCQREIYCLQCQIDEIHDGSFPYFLNAMLSLISPGINFYIRATMTYSGISWKKKFMEFLEEFKNQDYSLKS